MVFTLEVISGLTADDELQHYYDIVEASGPSADKCVERATVWIVDSYGDAVHDISIGDLPNYLYNRVVEAILEHCAQHGLRP